MRRLMFVILAACGGSPPHAASSSPDSEHHHHHGDHEPLGHRFEHADEWAPRFDDPARDAWQQPDRVVAALELAPGMTVADIGAGTGYFEARLSRAVGENGKVLALDIEPDMVRYMRERAAREKTPNVEARQSAPDDPTLGAASVDRILIVDTWHHIPDREAYAKKLAAALKPGGAVFVVDFTQETDKGPPRAHRIPPDQVIRELQAGAIDASLLPVGLPDQFIVKAAASAR
ncbi:MAG TPA: class I SAM-dependent methyltransferase [Kofleriaceae bacterium]|nr:class I SAM-dependent methyltransferase [Kofleriaceae bacterium]